MKNLFQYLETSRRYCDSEGLSKPCLRLSSESGKFMYRLEN